MNDLNPEKSALSYGGCPLNQVLQLLKLNVAIYHNAKVCGDWHLDAFQEHETSFHIITEGECWLEVPDVFSGQLVLGDLVIFPRAVPHTLQALDESTGEQQHLRFVDAQGLPGTGLLCGDVSFRHQGGSYLLDSLPAMWLIRAEEAKVWLYPLLMLIKQENNYPGPASGVIFDRISELLFSYAIRQYLVSKPTEASILALYGHDRLSAAVSAIHQTPAYPWRLEELAEKVHMSRTVFAEQFRKVSGWTVGQYITWWRMQLAWEHLQQGGDVATTAEQVGYQSEAAFSRAFKKTFAVSPGKVRQK